MGQQHGGEGEGMKWSGERRMKCASHGSFIRLLINSTGIKKYEGVDLLSYLEYILRGFILVYRFLCDTCLSPNSVL